MSLGCPEVFKLFVDIRSFSSRSIAAKRVSSQTNLVHGLSGSCGNVSAATKQRTGFDADPAGAQVTSDGSARNFGREFGEKFESFRTRMDRMRLQLLHDAVVLSRGGFPGRSQRSGNETSNNAMVSAGLCNPYVTIRFAFSVAVS